MLETLLERGEVIESELETAMRAGMLEQTDEWSTGYEPYATTYAGYTFQLNPGTGQYEAVPTAEDQAVAVPTLNGAVTHSDIEEYSNQKKEFKPKQHHSEIF